MNKRNKLFFITILSIIPCVIYNIMLKTEYNSYIYTSGAKLVLFAAFSALCFLITKVPRLKDILSPGGNMKAVKASGIIGAGCAFLIIIAFIVMRSLFDDDLIVNELGKEGITKATYPIVFIYIVFINAFLEEFFFRGFVFLTLYRMGYKGYAFAFSSVLFSLYHTTMILNWFSPLVFVICMIGLTGAGLIFNEIVRRCDNIYGGYFVHVGANIGINLIGAYLFLT